MKKQLFSIIETYSQYDFLNIVIIRHYRFRFLCISSCKNCLLLIFNFKLNHSSALFCIIIVIKLFTKICIFCVRTCHNIIMRRTRSINYEILLLCSDQYLSQLTSGWLKKKIIRRKRRYYIRTRTKWVYT